MRSATTLLVVPPRPDTVRQSASPTFCGLGLERLESCPPTVVAPALWHCPKLPWPEGLALCSIESPQLTPNFGSHSGCAAKAGAAVANNTPITNRADSLLLLRIAPYLFLCRLRCARQDSINFLLSARRCFGEAFLPSGRWLVGWLALV
jgi:hypothetical protein